MFLRSLKGDDPLTALWAYDLAEDVERLVADPCTLAAADDVERNASPNEQARLERTREKASGIVAYTVDRNAKVAAFVLEGVLWVADIEAGTCRQLIDIGPIFDPQLDEAGERLGFVYGHSLCVATLAHGDMRRLVGDDEGAAKWGVAEFVAAEEMGRHRGYWWAPDGTALLVARTDETQVRQWWIADTADPWRRPQAVRYPAAGTTNADVQLYLFGLGGAAPIEVRWDRDAFPYVVAAHWDDHGPMVTVQTRDQRIVAILAIDRHNGATEQIGRQADEAWVERIDGVPRRLSDGQLVTVEEASGHACLLVADRPVTPPEINVRSVLHVAGDSVWFSGGPEPTELHVWRWSAVDGLAQVTTDPGVHTAVIGGDVCVLGSSSLTDSGVRWGAGSHIFASQAETPVVSPTVHLTAVGDLELRVGVVFPSDHVPGRSLPVLLDPYGGPGHQRVLLARQLWLEPQWFADQGFAVVVVDGRGTPGRGRQWSKAIAGDLAGPPLDDQIVALMAVAAEYQDLDLTRVGIRGWSFGGYLAALAVMRRPDIFHAAIAGAPVTDWRLYDTHYSERYLGSDPQGADRCAYDQSSLLTGVLPETRRPLLLIHGLTDDNVFAAHTLLLSRRLLEVGWPHSTLFLPGVTHMTPQPAVTENLLFAQLNFLRGALSGSN